MKLRTLKKNSNKLWRLECKRYHAHLRGDFNREEILKKHLSKVWKKWKSLRIKSHKLDN